MNIDEAIKAKITAQVRTLDADELRNIIEVEHMKRATNIGLKGKKRTDDECAFIAGAMVAIQCITEGMDAGLSKSVPMQWVAASMRGIPPSQMKR